MLWGFLRGFQFRGREQLSKSKTIHRPKKPFTHRNIPSTSSKFKSTKSVFFKLQLCAIFAVCKCFSFSTPIDLSLYSRESPDSQFGLFSFSPNLNGAPFFYPFTPFTIISMHLPDGGAVFIYDFISLIDPFEYTSVQVVNIRKSHSLHFLTNFFASISD